VAAVPNESDAPRKHSRRVKFAYVVSRSGIEPWEWQPFPKDEQEAPDAPEPHIGIVASAEASRRGYYPQELRLDGKFSENLQLSKRNNELVVVFIDPKSVGANEQIMRDFDDMNLSNCGALILWDDGQAHPELEDRLQNDIFEDNYKRNYPKFFRDDVRSLAALRTNVADLLETLRISRVDRSPGQGPMPPGSASLVRL
jgi:hypothetical protein